MKVTHTTFEQKEALKEKSRKKIQALINYGFEVKTNDSVILTDSNKIANALENDETFKLTIPLQACICLKVSNMALKLLKPYIKDWLQVEQKATKTNYILFNYDEDIIEQLAPLVESNEHIQLTDTFEMSFNKYTLPTYTNTAKLYSVESAPTLTPKEVKKILDLHQRVINNQNNYFLLSNNISHSYNMPMTVLRKLGENVITLKALNILELLLIFATNSSAIYRQPTEDIKPFVIPFEFFSIGDFNLNQTNDEIINSLKELRAIGLINNVDCDENVFVIHSNLIAKSIKQYSYKQNLGYYRNLNLHQQEYVYTFLNYIRYVKNIEHLETTTDLAGKEIKRKVKAEKLTVTLEYLLYNLELEDYMHDLARLAKILDVLQKAGIQQGLLVTSPNPQSITKEIIKYLLTNRDKLHEVLILNPNEVRQDSLNSLTTSYYLPCSGVNSRNLIKR